MTQTITLKLFGESCNLHLLRIPDVIQKRISTTKNTPYNRLLDIDFYNKLKPYNSIGDLIDSSFNALKNTPTSKIEISKGRKRLANIWVNDLFNPTTLFPLYNIEMTSLYIEDLPHGVYLEETEIGLIDLYKIETENFDINSLKISLANFKVKKYNHQILYELTYKNKPLNKVKSDTLVRSQRCFKI